MRIIFLLALLPFAVFADSAGKNTSIYNVSVSADWKHNEPIAGNAASNYTSGQIQVSITNNTIIPLTFTKVKLKHYCQQHTDSNPLFIERDYSVAYKQRNIAPKATAKLPIKSFSKQNAGPCGAYGGVARSKIMSVEFHQDNMIPADHLMRCGDVQVPAVWAIDESLTSYIVYTDQKQLSFDFANAGSESAAILKQDVCDNRLPDDESTDKWNAMFAEKIIKWGSACSKYPDKCQQTYASIYRGWKSGAVATVAATTQKQPTQTQKAEVVTRNNHQPQNNALVNALRQSMTVSPASQSDAQPSSGVAVLSSDGCPSTPFPLVKKDTNTAPTNTVDVALNMRSCLYGTKGQYQITAAYPTGDAQQACSDPKLNPQLVMRQAMGNQAAVLENFGPVMVAPPPPQIEAFGFQFLHTPGTSGVQVLKVFPGSAAANSGLMMDDVIIAINGDGNAASSQISAQQALGASGGQATLTVKRPSESDQTLLIVIKKIVFTMPQQIIIQNKNNLARVMMEVPFDSSGQYQNWINAGQSFLKSVENLSITCN